MSVHPKLRPFRWHIALAVAVTAVFLLHLLSPSDYSGADSRFSLFLSQAILDTGSLRLDSMEAHVPLDPSDYRLFETNGHIYYNFPFGSSIFALPFVWAANHLLGIHILSTQVESSAMNLIAAVVMAVLFMLLVAIGRIFLGKWTALALSMIVMLGSSLTSSLGTSLWNLNFTLLFYAFSLWLILRFETGQDKSVHPIALGGSLFAAFLSRPTAAIFILLVLVYLLWRDWRQFIITAVTASLLLLGFSLIIHREIGMWLLPYYTPSRLEGSGSPMWLVWYGLLFSPGRGLFVFSPIFLIPLLVLPQNGRSWSRKPFFWLAVTWIVLHIASTATFPSWWGGASYGPRLLTDIVPAFYLLLLLWAQAVEKEGKSLWQTAAGCLLLLFAVVSLFINSYAALFNSHTIDWNGTNMLPNVDNTPDALLDWRHPQFLATAASNCARNQMFYKHVWEDNLIILSSYAPHIVITADDTGNGRLITMPPPGSKPMPAPSTKNTLASLLPRVYLPMVAQNAPLYALMPGWYLPQSGRALALCNETSIVVGPSEITGDYVWQLTAVAVRPAPVSVFVNGTQIGAMQVGTETAVYKLPFSATLLSTEQDNQIAFSSTGDGNLADNFQFISLAMVKASGK